MFQYIGICRFKRKTRWVLLKFLPPPKRQILTWEVKPGIGGLKKEVVFRQANIIKVDWVTGLKPWIFKCKTRWVLLMLPWRIFNFKTYPFGLAGEKMGVGWGLKNKNWYYEVYFWKVWKVKTQMGFLEGRRKFVKLYVHK